MRAWKEFWWFWDTPQAKLRWVYGYFKKMKHLYLHEDELSNKAFQNSLGYIVNSWDPISVGIYEEAKMNMCHGFLCKEGIWTRCHLNPAMIPSNVVSDHSTSVLYLFGRLLLLELMEYMHIMWYFRGKALLFSFYINPQFRASLGHWWLMLVMTSCHRAPTGVWFSSWITID